MKCLNKTKTSVSKFEWFDAELKKCRNTYGNDVIFSNIFDGKLLKKE